MVSSAPVWVKLLGMWLSDPHCFRGTSQKGCFSGERRMRIVSTIFGSDLNPDILNQIPASWLKYW